MKLRYARIITHDVNKMVAFYHQITGITPEIKSPDYVELPTSAGTLAIGSQRSMDMYGASATTPAANRSAIVEFEVEDVDKERARLVSVIDKCVLEPTTQPWGNRSMLFRDPDGNLINFFTPVGRAKQPEPAVVSSRQ